MRNVYFTDAFANLDKNNDGFVIKSEVEAFNIAWSAVKIYDLNSTYMMQLTLVLHMNWFYSVETHNPSGYASHYKDGHETDYASKRL